MTDNLKFELRQFRILQRELLETKRVMTEQEINLMIEIINQLEDELLYVESFLNR